MAELDEFEDGLEHVEEKPRRGRLQPNRRWFIIGGVLVLLLVVASFGFLFRGRTQKGAIATAADALSISQEDAAQAEKKAKEEQQKKQKRIKYMVLYPQLNQVQAADVTRELSYEGVDFTIQQNGKNYGISVDDSKLDAARMSLAAKGIPFGMAQGYQLLDGGQTLGVTEFDKRVRFVRALSGELENAIRNMAAVETCRVQVVIPEQRLFAVTQPPVTAAVMIRKTEDGDLTDDVIFSIIQYVASAVENLQPENVTVVDMIEGKVLSEGIFERIAARQAGQAVPSLGTSSENAAVLGQPAAENARPVLPDLEDISQWYSVKSEYEKNLIDRATKQLVGVLPVGAFKIAITADLGALSGGEIVDVKRLTTSVVVDNNREDIFLDADLKREIFNTVAASIGYVRGRDLILLNRADFALMSPDEKTKLEASLRQKENLRTVFLFAGTIVALIAFALIIRRIFLFVRARKKTSSLQGVREELSEDGLISKTGTGDFGTLQVELDKERRFEPVRAVADSDPEILAQIMENWLGEVQQARV